MKSPNSSSSRPNHLSRRIAASTIAALSLISCSEAKTKNSAPTETVALASTLPIFPEIKPPTTLPEATRAALNTETAKFVSEKASLIKAYADPEATDAEVFIDDNNSDGSIGTTIIKWFVKDGQLTQVDATVSEYPSLTGGLSITSVVFAEHAVTSIKGQALNLPTDRAVNFKHFGSASGVDSWDITYIPTNNHIDLLTTGDQDGSLRPNTIFLGTNSLDDASNTAMAIFTDLINVPGLLLQK